MALKLCTGFCFGLLLIHTCLTAGKASFGSQCTNQCDVKELLAKNETLHLTVLTSDNDTGRSYPVITYVEQMTVSLAMRNLHNETNDFAYTTKYNHGYGDEVKSINGIPDTQTYFWELRINGHRARCGMDTYRLKRGDKISWKLLPRP